MKNKEREFKYYVDVGSHNNGIKKIITFNVTDSIRIVEDANYSNKWVVEILGKKHLFKKNEWYRLISTISNSPIIFSYMNDAIKYVNNMFKSWKSTSISEKDKVFKMLSCIRIEDLSNDELMFCYNCKDISYSTKLILDNEIKHRNIKT